MLLYLVPLKVKYRSKPTLSVKICWSLGAINGLSNHREKAAHFKPSCAHRFSLNLFTTMKYPLFQLNVCLTLERVGLKGGGIHKTYYDNYMIIPQAVVP